MIQSPRLGVNETEPGAGGAAASRAWRDLTRSIFKRVVVSADNACVAAHIDFASRRYFEDLLAAREPEPIPVAEPPVLVGATLADIPGARTPDVFMVVGSLGVFAWTIVATEIVLRFH